MKYPIIFLLIETYTKGRTATNMCTIDPNSIIEYNINLKNASQQIRSIGHINLNLLKTLIPVRENMDECSHQLRSHVVSGRRHATLPKRKSRVTNQLSQQLYRLNIGVMSHMTINRLSFWIKTSKSYKKCWFLLLYYLVLTGRDLEPCATKNKVLPDQRHHSHVETYTCWTFAVNVA